MVAPVLSLLTEVGVLNSSFLISTLSTTKYEEYKTSHCSLAKHTFTSYDECILSPCNMLINISVGVAMLMTYKVTCSNWIDEGDSPTRDLNTDTLRNAELHYQFFMWPEGANSEYEMFHFGSDPETPDCNLAMGYRRYGYHVPIIIRVSDSYGEFTEYVIHRHSCIVIYSI